MIAPELDLVPRRTVVDGPIDVRFALRPGDRALVAAGDTLGPGSRILDRAEGVPLYAVETVRMLLDRGLLEREGDAYRPTGPIEALEVPETLHALVAARLDGLASEERRVLQDAAVLQGQPADVDHGDLALGGQRGLCRHVEDRHGAAFTVTPRSVPR